MRKTIRIIFAAALIVMAGSCRDRNLFSEDDVVASVGERVLLKSDITGIFTPGLSEQDSLSILNSYIETWVNKQLKVMEAEKLFTSSQADIDRMVEDYRTSLLTYRFDQVELEPRVDTVFTDQDIFQYYEEHKNDFILDRPIVKGKILRLPSDHRQKAQVMELMSATGDKYQDFLDISSKNGFQLYEAETWRDFSDFTSNLPSDIAAEAGSALTRNTPVEFRSGADSYLVYISQKILPGEVSPVERAASVIRRVLVNQRRQDVIRNYEDSLYNSALSNRNIEIRIRK